MYHTGIFLCSVPTVESEIWSLEKTMRPTVTPGGSGGQGVVVLRLQRASGQDGTAGEQTPQWGLR